MATQTQNGRDVVVIGGGHNGLVTAFYLAKAGYKPLVLERSAQVGGAAVTDEFHPGFRCSKLAHATGPVRPEIVSDMNLASHGLTTYSPDVRTLSLSADGHPLALYSDTGRTQQEIAKYSTKEAANYSELQKALANIAAVLDQLLHMTPPDVDELAAMTQEEQMIMGAAVEGVYIVHRRNRFPIPGTRVTDPKAAQCGEVLKGVLKPAQCKLFGKECTP